MNHFEAALPPTHFTFNPQVSNSAPKSQSFDHLVSDSGSSNMPIDDDYGDSDGNGQFNDVLPGFGNKGRPKPESRWSFRSIGRTNKLSQDSNEVSTSKSLHVASSGTRKANGTSVSSDGAKAYDDLDPFGSLGKSMSSFSSLKTDAGKEGSPMRTQGTSEHPTYSSKETAEQFSGRSPGGYSGKKSIEDNRGSPRGFFKMPSVFMNSRKSFRQAASSSRSSQVKTSEKSDHVDNPHWSQKTVESSDDVWLTVSEVPLFTQPTRAPPPSRPPPPTPVQFLKTRGSSVGSSGATKIHEFSSFQDLNGHSKDRNSVPMATRSSTASGMDESGRVAMGGSRNTSNGFSCDEVGVQPDRAASPATVKEAMDRAETKFQHAKGMRESRPGAEEKSTCREQERLEQGQQQKGKEDREQWKLEKERKEQENEQRRLKKERERARQAVERATREARERAAAEARLKAEKAALEKASAEARQLAERTAVQRAQAEARERAAALAKERAEKAAAEAREQEARKKAFEVQMKAERAAAEAQEKAAAEAQEKVAAAAKAPKFSSKQSAEVVKASAATVSRLREASSVTNLVDGLSSVFDGVASVGDFQEFEGESEERRNARLERHQKTQERAARALAEMNQRDLQIQREQEERHRIAETLDTEIKRWAAGKEGNLRALLSTLQYVLWPECGWQPVSLIDLMTTASVKKVYRKATLCIHPDKVQQKGANLQQKYIAEKVFDLLKEAWNKFNSVELF